MISKFLFVHILEPSREDFECCDLGHHNELFCLVPRDTSGEITSAEANVHQSFISL